MHAFALWGREGNHSDLAGEGLGSVALAGGEECVESGFDLDARQWAHASRPLRQPDDPPVELARRSLSLQIQGGSVKLAGEQL